MKKQYLILGAISLCLAGCNTVTPLHPTATNVVTMDAAPAQGCHFIKHLSVRGKNGSDAPYRSHEDIQQDQLNQLKNATAQLGGNLFVLEAHHTTYQTVSLNSTGTLTTGGAKTTGVSLVDHHMMAGDAYSCSADVLTAATAANPAVKNVANYNDAG